MPKKTPLTDAAQAMGLTYHQLRAHLLRGRVHGGRDEFGRWYVLTRATADGRLVAATRRRKARPT